MTNGRRSPPPPYASTDNLPDQPPPYSATRVSTNDSIPVALKAYFSKDPFSRTFHLGESSKNPLYTVSARSSKSSSALLYLHQGSSRRNAVMASVELLPEDFTGKGGLIDVFPEGSAPRGTHGNDYTNDLDFPHQLTLVYVKHTSDWNRAKHTFVMKVGTGDSMRSEKFEWRRSHGAEVHELHANLPGYKLVRLGREAPSGGFGGPRLARQKGESSDGKEVVAAVAMSNSSLSPKYFKLKRLGSGATGELGNHFAIVTLTSALKIWCIEHGGTDALAGVESLLRRFTRK